MGSSTSKLAEAPPKRKKSECLDDVRKSVRNIHQQLDAATMRYGSDVYFSQLSRESKTVQTLRSSMKKKADLKKCETVLDEINQCIAILETKEASRESNLDFGAVESTSFISQDLDRLAATPECAPEIPKMDHRRRLDTLPEIKRKVNSLDMEIRRTVQLDDYKNYPLLEKKVKMLYEDLELVDAMEYTPLHEEKEKLAARLIKFNNKIVQMQRRSMDLTFHMKPFQTDDLMTLIKIEQDLSDLEVRALTFEDTRNDATYEPLNDALRQTFVTLNKLTIKSDEGRKRISNALSLTKKILQEFGKKVAENEEVLRKEMSTIDAIEIEVKAYKRQAEIFQGNKDSTHYLNLDRNLRHAREKLGQVAGSSGKARHAKEHLMKEIQGILQGLHEKVDNWKPESALIGRVESFNVAWMNIERMLKAETDNAEALEMLRNIEVSLRKVLDPRRNSRTYSNQVMTQLVKEMAGDQVDLRKTPSIGGSVRKIQSVERDIRELKEQLRQFRGTTDSESYDHFEAQLLQFSRDLEAVDASANGTLHKAKIKGMKELNEARQILQKSAEKNDEDRGKRISRVSIRNSRSQSSSGALEKIFSVESSARSLQMPIQEYKGTPDEAAYNEMQTKLNEFTNDLITLNVGNHDNLHTSKMDTLQLVEKLQANLTHIASKNDAMRSKDLKEVKEILKRVHATKKKIDCFSGTFKSVEYVELEEALKVCKADLDGIQSVFKKVLESKVKGAESIDRLLKVLEEKSIKSEPQMNSQQLIEKARNNLLEVKEQMENFSGKHKDEEYYKIINKLHACNDDINSITMDRRQSINASKLQYLQYIQDLLKYFEEKVQSKEYTEAVQDNEEVEEQSKVNKAMLDLEKIERSVNSLKEDVDNFIGSKNDNNYNGLDLEINQMMSRVDKVTSLKNPRIRSKRIKLLEELQRIAKNLDDKCGKGFEPKTQTLLGRVLQDIAQISSELEFLNKEIDNFFGSKNDAVHTRLDETLIKLFLKLDNVENHGSHEIKEAKQKAMKEIQKSMALLDRRVKNLMGTEV